MKENIIAEWTDTNTGARNTMTVEPLGEAVHVILRQEKPGEVALVKGVVARTQEIALRDSTFRIKSKLPESL